MIDEAGIVSPSLDFCLKKGWEDSAGVLGAVRGMNSFPPYGFSIENVASRERLSSVKLEGVLESLRARGFRAMRQPFSSGSAVKTDASYVEVLEAVRRYPRQTR